MGLVNYAKEAFNIFMKKQMLTLGKEEVRAGISAAAKKIDLTIQKTPYITFNDNQLVKYHEAQKRRFKEVFGEDV